jgi:hypothetical protein
MNTHNQDDNAFGVTDPTVERIRAILAGNKSASEDAPITEEDDPVPPDHTDTDIILTRSVGTAPGQIPRPAFEALTRRTLQRPKGKNANALYFLCKEFLPKNGFLTKGNYYSAKKVCLNIDDGILEVDIRVILNTGGFWINFDGKKGKFHFIPGSCPLLLWLILQDVPLYTPTSKDQSKNQFICRDGKQLKKAYRELTEWLDDFGRCPKFEEREQYLSFSELRLYFTELLCKGEGINGEIRKKRATHIRKMLIDYFGEDAIIPIFQFSTRSRFLALLKEWSKYSKKEGNLGYLTVEMIDWSEKTLFTLKLIVSPSLFE